MAPDVSFHSRQEISDKACNERTAQCHKTLPTEAGLVNPAYLADREPCPESHWPDFQAQMLPTTLKSLFPNEWPTHVRSPLVWDGNDFEDEQEYIEVLSIQDQAEIKAAVTHFKDLDLDGSEVNRDNFPLPSLGNRLRRLSIDLHQGKGFFVLRGLNPNGYDVEDNTIIFLGISSYIGEERRKQDYDGNILIHILEDMRMKCPRIERGYEVSNNKFSFHTDEACDIVALQTMDSAAKGGRTLLASVATLYNEMAKSRPDLLSCLALPNWFFKNFDHEPKYHRRPILFYHDSSIIMNFARHLLLRRDPQDLAQGIPPVSPLQTEALSTINTIAKAHQLAIATQPGDLLYFNNLGILHGREAFENSSSNKRHLVRLWLRNTRLAWCLPTPLQTVWHRINDDEEIEERYQVRPVPRFQLRQRFKYN